MVNGCLAVLAAGNSSFNRSGVEYSRDRAASRCDYFGHAAWRWLPAAMVRDGVSMVHPAALKRVELRSLGRSRGFR